ncbi:hypothetical protein ACHAWF_007123 [Thalassiosira exigua]
MTDAHKIEDYEAVTKASNKMIMIENQAFEVVATSAPMTGEDEVMRARRLVSDRFDEQQQAVVTPTVSEEYAAGAGNGNIEFKYHVDPKVLGTGHHGSVRKCVDRSTLKRCAVKSIRKADLKRAVISREIALLREMKHQNIVELVDVFEDNEYVHLVTDLCEGGELFDRIVQMSSNDANGAPCFEEARAARILRQILTAVSHMHEHGVVHRDIKPENILFETSDEDSPIKIIDFGLSRKHVEGRDSAMKTIVGTPYYIAPEVLRRRYDRSCDLWSVGVIAYILLCGYPPFNGTNSEQTHRAVLRGRYSFPAEEWQGVSREAMDFVVRLLQMDPRRRMTAKEALEHPWIVEHADIDEAMSEDESLDDVSVDAVVNESTRAQFCNGHMV